MQKNCWAIKVLLEKDRVNMISTLNVLGVPEGFGELLLAFSFILLIAPYAAGADFGVLKVPDFSDIGKRQLKLWGPVALLISIVLFLPLWDSFDVNGEPDLNSPETVPLVLWWNGERKDYFSTSTTGGEGAARRDGYERVRKQASVYRSQLPGTEPLVLYWHEKREDNFTTSTRHGAAAAEKAGYCVFRPIPITHTGLIRSPVLEHTDHRFWFYSITFTGFPESVIGIQNG
jgi:hypothetical protein